MNRGSTLASNAIDFYISPGNVKYVVDCLVMGRNFFFLIQIQDELHVCTAFSSLPIHVFFIPHCFHKPWKV